MNETATSIRDDESRVGSNNLRSSQMIDLEDSGHLSNSNKDSMQRVDLLNRSLNQAPRDEADEDNYSSDQDQDEAEVRHDTIGDA